MQVAGIQHDIVWEDPDANLAHLAGLVSSAAGAGARLVALSEMYSTGFSTDTARVAEAPDGPSARFLADIARAEGIWVCGSIPTRDPARELPVNRLVLAGPDGTTHHYDKIHPFTYAKEHHFYSAGSAHVVVDVDGLRVALFVCYDLRFADEFWALAHHTDLYVVVANWPESRRHHWRTLLRARAIENQAYVLGVNRVGTGNGLVYVGDSVLLDPLGEVVDEAREGAEDIITGAVDPATVAAVRGRFPFLADRR